MAQIYGQLKKAGFESLAADPTGTGLFEGRKWFNTTDGVIRYYDGAATHEFADLDTAQTFVNKTLTSPQINTPTIDTPTIDGEQILEELSATPATPAAGYKKLYPKDDGLLYTLNDNGDEVPVGSGSGSGGFKNYIEDQNSTFDLINTDYALYNDGAADPVDLTGGAASGNLAVALTSVVGEVLAGARSLEMAKSAASALGEGISALTQDIDQIDRGRTLKLSFAKKSSANYVSGDIKVYLYDVTNSVFLPISSDYDQDIIQGTGKQEYFVEMGLTTESVRIGFHVASTNALAYDLFLDEIKLEVQDVFIPNNIGGWKEYPFTGEQGLGTPGTVEMFYRELGENLEIYGRFSPSSETAAEKRYGLPSGYTVKSDVPTNSNIGNYFSSNATTSSGGMVIANADNTFIQFGPSQTFNNISTTATSPSSSTLVGNGNFVHLRASIPVNELAGASIDGLVKNALLKSETKVLTADITTNTTISDYTFSDLVIGRKYLVTGPQHFLSTAADGTFYITATHNSSVKAVVGGGQEAAGSKRTIPNFGFTFTAETTSITFETVDFGGSVTLEGNGTNAESYIQIQEIPFSQTAIVQQNKVAYLADEQTSGTNGGSSTSGVQDRVLNTLDDNYNIISDLTSNVFKFSSVGVYFIEGSAPAYLGVRHKALLTLSDNTVLFGGTSEYQPGANAQTRSFIEGYLTVTNITQGYKLRHYISNAQATTGLGVPTINGTNETFAQIKITKIGG